MKPKTQQSFADIFDALQEGAKTPPADVWVLIIKFQRIKSAMYNDALRYVVSPLSELSKKNKDIYRKATNWMRPAYNKKIELNLGPDIGGIDMGKFKAEVFRGTEADIKGELESHKRVYKMKEDAPVPMKPETAKHFGDIVS
jgi:hypothetical protein